MEQTKTKKKLSLWKKIAIGVLVLIVLGAIFGKDDQSSAAAASNSQQPVTSSNEDESPSVTVSAPALIKAYEDNEVSADNKYKDKTVQVTGYIKSIAKDITDDSYVTLGTDDEDDFSLTSVQCYFKSGNNLANLKKGQKLTVVGTVDGKMGNVLVKGCNIK